MKVELRQTSGWTNNVIFYEWLGHFVAFKVATRDNRVRLILDNHDSFSEKSDQSRLKIRCGHGNLTTTP